MRCSSLPTRGCAEAGGMEEATLFKRKVSDRSTVTPSGKRWYRSRYRVREESGEYTHKSGWKEKSI